MINPMKKVLLAARSADREKALEILRAAEIVHVEPVDPSTVAVPAKLAEEIENCQKAIAILEQSGDDGREKLATPGTPTRLVEEVIDHAKTIEQSNDRIVELKRELEESAAWGKLGLKDVKWLRNNGLNLLFVKGPSESAESLKADCQALIMSEGANGIYALASKEPVEIPQDFVEVRLPEREIEQIQEEIESLRNTIADNRHSLQSIALRSDEIEKHLTRLVNRRRYSEVDSGLMRDESIVVLTGWVPAENTSDLSSAFEKAGLPVGIEFADPTEEDVPPTAIKASSMAQSIQPLYDFMGVVPSYNEPDTSGLFLSMLTVFAAFLIADAGYGLLVVLALIAAYKPLVQKGADKAFLHLGLFLFGGVSIYGLLTNTWFGETYMLFKGYTFDPNTNEGMVHLQGICFLMGALHLTIAHVWKVRRKPIDISVLSDIGWICFLWGMYGIICGLILKQDFLMPSSWIGPLFKVSAILILFFTAPSWNILKSFAAGVGAILQNASNCFSDIVSYIRLWAVGLAGGKVAGAFNDIAAMLPSFFLRLPVWIIGHGINIILGIIAILAHGVRLNLLEFSNHLELDWAGRKYDPFKEIK